MAKHTLSIEVDYDYLLIGIGSYLKPHQIAYWLNRNLEIFLERSKTDHEFWISNNAYACPWFTFYQEFYRVKYCLFKNKVEGVPLLNNFKQLDYLLKLEGNYNEVKPLVLKSLKEIEGVIYTKEIPLSTVKDPLILITD
ncbi:MAG: IPExxxVDY family protein [Luteibaculaceae bacterium]